MSKETELIHRIASSGLPEEADLERALSFTSEEDLRALFAYADTVRDRKSVV